MDIETRLNNKYSSDLQTWECKSNNYSLNKKKISTIGIFIFCFPIKCQHKYVLSVNIFIVFGVAVLGISLLM